MNEIEKTKPPPGFKPKPKRGVMTSETIEENELLEIIKNMKEPYRSYAAFTYLGGSRVSEGIGAPPKKQIIGSQERFTKVGKNYKKKKFPIYSDLPVSTPTQPIRKKDIKISEDGMLYFHNMPILKSPDRHIGQKYVDPQGEGEKEFVNILYQHIKDKDEEEPLWTFNRFSFYRQIIKASKGRVFPHKLRSMRATKDVNTYRLDVPDIMNKYEWKNVQIALGYVKTSQKNVIDKIKRQRTAGT